MDNDEIRGFVNSKDIRRHLVDIDYEFSPTEAAWLVCQNRNFSLKEKWAAWNDIIETMPDEKVDSFHFERPCSLHDTLKDYISLQEDIIRKFHIKNPKTFYQCSFEAMDYECDFNRAAQYSDFETCLMELKKQMDDDDGILTGYIRRCEIDAGPLYIMLCFRKDGEINGLDIKFYDDDHEWDNGLYDNAFDWDLYYFFENIWLCFPAPFKKGDILYDPYRQNSGFCSGPVVMTGITPAKYKEDGRKHADGSDMNVWGYFQDEDSGKIYHEVTWNYMDYEYYPKEMLTGKKRILKALSNLLKEKIDIELFITAYHLIILEEMRNDLEPGGWFTEEGLELAGLKDKKTD